MSRLSPQLTVIFCIFCVPIHILRCSAESPIISIAAISNLDAADTGRSIVGGQWLAIQEINDNPLLLSNFTLDFQVFDAETDPEMALIYAFNITQQYKKNPKNIKDSLIFPIVLGTPWSTLSTSAAPILGGFDMALLTSGSTSIALSSTAKYPHFYRTIPSDELQAEGLILLCKAFNWTSIMIVFVNDAYGLYLSFSVSQLAVIHDIEVHSIPVAFEDDKFETSYAFAAKQIKELEIYIIMLLVHSSNDGILTLFSQFNDAGIIGYPYYYVGVDAWFGWDLKLTANIKNLVPAGLVGMIPWQTRSLSLDEYEEDTAKIVNQSMIKLDGVLKEWEIYYNEGYNDKGELTQQIPGTQMIYGYDAMYAIAYTMQQIIDNGYDLEELLMGDPSVTIHIIDEILKEEIDFIGLSGHVIFDNVGDRKNGLYSYGNILENGSVNYFGYLYQFENGTVKSIIHKEKIFWPSYFTEKGIIPRSDYIIYHEITTVNTVESIIFFILLMISLIVAVGFIVFLGCYRKNKIIRAASWRLNLIMCFGAICGYIGTVLYGIDELRIDQHHNDQLLFICNLRVWVMTVSSSILFMPLFLKTYRLSLLFKSVLTGKLLKDKTLIMVIFACIMIDVILLAFWTAFNPFIRDYHDLRLEVIDEIQEIQYVYGHCESKTNKGLSIYVVLVFWKLIQLFFGFYVAMDVARITDVTDMLSKLNETSIQLLSILFTFITACITIPIFLFGPIENPNIYYLVVSISVLLIGNIVICLNLCPRTIAVFTKNESKYATSMEQRMEKQWRRELRKLTINQQKTPLLLNNEFENDL